MGTSPEAASPTRRRLLFGLFGVVAAGGLAGCAGDGGTAGGGTGRSQRGAGTPGSGAAAGADATGLGTIEADAADRDETEPDANGTEMAAPRGDADLTVVATSVVEELRVHPQPADPDDAADPAGATVDRVLDRREEVSGQVVLLALDVGAAWVRVQLPVRPNGTTGWVRARDVSLASHGFAVDIALGAHRLRLTRSGREVIDTAIGVGTTDTPTPGGDYFIKELLQPPDPTGVYGPYAYGLSGYSTVLTEFAGGDGVIGIHGTDRPDLVGTDVSSGCIRLPNDVIIALVEDIGLPLGTPVTIRA